MATGPTPERSAVDRMIGAYKRLQEKRTAAPAPSETATVNTGETPPATPTPGS